MFNILCFYLTYKITEHLSSENFACGIFGDFQKAFDIVDHAILIEKLYHYGITGAANDWLLSYVQDCSMLL